MKEAFEKMTGMPDAWTNPALMVSRNAFIQGWEARTQHDVDATIIQYHEATIKRLEKRIEDLAQPAQEPVGVFCEDDDIGYVRLIPHQQMKLKAWDKLYTTPQQRPWIGLTEEEIDYLYVEHRGDGGPTAICEQFAKAYEAYLKEKNT